MLLLSKRRHVKLTESCSKPNLKKKCTKANDVKLAAVSPCKCKQRPSSDGAACVYWCDQYVCRKPSDRLPATWPVYLNRADEAFGGGHVVLGRPAIACDPHEGTAQVYEAQIGAGPRGHALGAIASLRGHWRRQLERREAEVEIVVIICGLSLHFMDRCYTPSTSPSRGPFPLGRDCPRHRGRLRATLVTSFDCDWLGEWGVHLGTQKEDKSQSQNQRNWSH